MRGRNPLKWKWRIIELIRLKIWSMLVGNYKKICFSLWRKMEIENQKIIIRINNFNESCSIEIYPNPVKDKVTIESIQKTKIEILSLEGQQ